MAIFPEDWQSHKIFDRPIDLPVASAYLWGMKNEATPTTGKTSLGFEIAAWHPMAHVGGCYRFTTIVSASVTNVHVDEYVPSIGQWLYLGTLVGGR